MPFFVRIGETGGIQTTEEGKEYSNHGKEKQNNLQGAEDLFFAAFPFSGDLR